MGSRLVTESSESSGSELLDGSELVVWMKQDKQPHKRMAEALIKKYTFTTNEVQVRARTNENESIDQNDLQH